MTKFCSACGQALEDFDRFCFRCGTSQTTMEYPAQPFRQEGYQVSWEAPAPPAPPPYMPELERGVPARTHQIKPSPDIVKQIIWLLLPPVTIIIPLVMLGLSFASAAGRLNVSFAFSIAELILGALLWYLLMFKS